MMDGLHSLNRRGVLPDDSWAVLESALAGLLKNPLVKSYAESRVTPFAPQFHELIRKLFERPPDDAWRYTPLADLGAKGERKQSAVQQAIAPDVE